LLLECPCDIAAPGRRRLKRRQIAALQGVDRWIRPYFISLDEWEVVFLP
jgi:hypothetical protein